MTQTKLEQIRAIRRAVVQLRESPYFPSCACCKSDLDTIEAYADAPYASAFLAQVRRRLDAHLVPASTHPRRDP